MPEKREYLGDSVYIELDHDTICLMTNNGQGPTNIIYLEQEVYKALIAYVQRNPAIRNWST